MLPSHNELKLFAPFIFCDRLCRTGIFFPYMSAESASETSGAGAVFSLLDALTANASPFTDAGLAAFSASRGVSAGGWCLSRTVSTSAKSWRQWL